MQNLYSQYNGSNAPNFDPDTPSVVQGPNAAAGTPLTLLMSLWSPPAAIKSNKSVNNGGTLNTVNSGYNYAGFGQFWHDSLAAYAALGETPQSSEIAALGHHLYNVSSTDPNPDDGSTALQTLGTQFPAAQKFMTEYYDAPGFNTAWNIHNALTLSNDNAYFYWGLTWPSTPVTNGQAADQQGLLYIDNPFASQVTWASPQGWSYNDAYYAFKHFSYFIRPGYVRYNATVSNADELISAYQSPDKKTVVAVVMNISTSATDQLALNVGGLTYSTSTVYRSTFSTPISTGERWNNLGAFAAGGVSLPPQSVVTIVLQQ